jgi:putative membrane protein
MPNYNVVLSIQKKGRPGKFCPNLGQVFENQTSSRYNEQNYIIVYLSATNVLLMQANTDKKVSDHLANERTFLAWIRTGIGIMAFGFVVVKFSLFVKQLSLLLNKQYVYQEKGYSSAIGIVLVAVGAVTTLLAYARYKKSEKQINDDTYQNSSLLITLLTCFIIFASILLIAYLIKSI